jgi:ketosteroid isomerase-like protein
VAVARGAHEEALREAISLFNDRLDAYLADPNAPIDPFWADDVELINFEPSPFPGTYRGHEGLRRWAQDMFGDLTDGRIDAVEIVEEGDRMAVRMKLSGSGRSSGIPGSLEFGSLLSMRDGKCIQAASDISFERTLERLRAGEGSA